MVLVLLASMVGGQTCKDNKIKVVEYNVCVSFVWGGYGKMSVCSKDVHYYF